MMNFVQGATISLFISLLFSSNCYALLGANKMTEKMLSWRSAVFFDYYVHRGCTGVFVSDKEILTAAHCIAPDPEFPNEVHYDQLDGPEKSLDPHARIHFFRGGAQLEVESPWMQRFKVEGKLAIPEYYRKGKRMGDIGLLRFEKSPLPSDEYKPISRMTREVSRDPRTKYYVIGRDMDKEVNALAVSPVRLGKLDDSGTYITARLQKGVICQGDSGAPLVALLDNTLYAVGVLSGPANGNYKSHYSAYFGGNIDCAKSVYFTLYGRKKAEYLSTLGRSE